MAQAFEGALVALHRVAEERAADCADEVARHRCVRRVHTAVRAVVRAGRSRRRAAPPRDPTALELARSDERVLTPTTGGLRAQLLAAELCDRDEGAAGGAACWVRLRLRLPARFAPLARCGDNNAQPGAQSRPCAAGEACSWQGACFDQPLRRCVPCSSQRLPRRRRARRRPWARKTATVRRLLRVAERYV